MSLTAEMAASWNCWPVMPIGGIVLWSRVELCPFVAPLALAFSEDILSVDAVSPVGRCLAT
jgi:hypothetical protein